MVRCDAVALAIAAAVSHEVQAVADGGGACEGLQDCNFAGDCVNSACVCDVAWTGENCGSLALEPVPASGGVYPAGAHEGKQSTWTWGAAGVRGDDGLYHFYVTQWRNHCPMTYPDFISQTHIVHVTAPAAEGPYTEMEEVVPGAAGNPVYTKAPDGTHLLYFTNYRYDGPVKNCSSGTVQTDFTAGTDCDVTEKEGQDLPGSDMSQMSGLSYEDCRASCCSDARCVGFTFEASATPWRACVEGKSCCYLKDQAADPVQKSGLRSGVIKSRIPKACGIHLASSKSLDGPWDITYDIAYGTEGHWDNCSLTNPGPFMYDNGTALMMFKLCRYEPNCPKGRYIMGLLTGNSWEGPYSTRPRADPIWNSTDSVEDPSNGWMDHRGTLHMIVHKGLNRGMSIHSTDGVNWQYAESMVAYPETLQFEDGTSLKVNNRQEPKVILDPSTGQPTHLLNICGIGGIAHTFVCVQPIRVSKALQVV